MLKNGLIVLVLAATLAPWPSEARVVRFVVEQKRPLAEGTTFGSAGAYERLDGTAYFEVDPKDPLNAIIVNLDKAPRNARGMVEFSSPFVILKPVEMAKGNHKIYVPKPDQDGLDIAGVRPIEIRVPIGTHTGWNVRKEGFRAPSMCPLTGSFIPFAATKEQRVSAGDPRKSLEERYGAHDGYANAVKDATKALVAERFLLQEDATRFIKEAETGEDQAGQRVGVNRQE